MDRIDAVKDIQHLIRCRIEDAHAEIATAAQDYERHKAARDAENATPEEKGRSHAYMDLTMTRWTKALGAEQALQELQAAIANDPLHL